MKFGQVFIGMNLLIDHQVSASFINRPDIANHAIPNELASQTSTESSGVLLPLAHEQLGFVPKPPSVKALKDYGMDSSTKEMSQYHYRRLGQDEDQHFDSQPSVEAVGMNPRYKDEKKSTSPLVSSDTLALGSILGTGLYAAVKTAWEFIESTRTRYQHIIDQLDIRYHRYWQ